MEVALVRWPVDAGRRSSLAVAAAPRLLLVESGTPPPLSDDCFEDWIRVPAADEDIALRASALRARVVAHARDGGRRSDAVRPPEVRADLPVVDEDGLLRFGSRWVVLPPVEARLTGVLAVRFGAVVSRESLSRAGWPHGAPGRNSLDVHVLRLRRRISSLELIIRTVRSRGYLLETTEPRTAAGF